MQGGVSPNHCDHSGKIALHYAAKSEKIESLEQILNIPFPGFSILARNNRISSWLLYFYSLFLARIRMFFKKGYLHIVEKLIEAGTNIDAKDETGDTGFALSCWVRET